MQTNMAERRSPHFWSDGEDDMGQFDLILDSPSSTSDSELLQFVEQIEVSQSQRVSPTVSAIQEPDSELGFGISSRDIGTPRQTPLPEQGTLGEEEGQQAPRRFPVIEDDELDTFETCMESKGTKRQTQYGVKLFKQWLSENQKSPEFECMGEIEVAENLRGFYASARNASGGLYSKSTYVGLRASINRYLRGAPHNKTFSILNDPNFHQANNMFKAMLKRIKREGLDTTKHHHPISDKDFNTLKMSTVLDIHHPVSLQKKVWFDITLSFARRGRENLRQLKADAFCFKKDENGLDFVEMAYNEATKNHQGDDIKDKDFERKPRMYATGSDRCPVLSLQKYLSKRNKSNDIFFQKATTKNVTEEDDIWYTTRPLGEKTLENFMKNISISAGLSQVYTNHCVKATTITRLAHAGVETREIMRISGHRNEGSIKSYNSDSSEEQKRLYSSILHGENLPVRKPMSLMPVQNIQNTTHTYNNNVNNNLLPISYPMMSYMKQFEVHNSTINVYNYQ